MATYWNRCFSVADILIKSRVHRVHTEPGKLGIQAIFTKSQGKPEIVREFYIVFN